METSYKPKSFFLAIAISLLINCTILFLVLLLKHTFVFTQFCEKKKQTNPQKTTYTPTFFAKPKKPKPITTKKLLATPPPQTTQPAQPSSATPTSNSKQQAATIPKHGPEQKVIGTGEKQTEQKAEIKDKIATEKKEIPKQKAEPVEQKKIRKETTKETSQKIEPKKEIKPEKKEQLKTQPKKIEKKIIKASAKPEKIKTFLKGEKVVTKTKTEKPAPPKTGEKEKSLQKKAKPLVKHSDTKKEQRLREIVKDFQITSPLIKGGKPKILQKVSAPAQKPMTFADLLKGFTSQLTENEDPHTKHNPMMSNYNVHFYLTEEARYVERATRILNKSLINFLMTTSEDIRNRFSKLDNKDFSVYITFNKQRQIVGLRIDPPFSIREFNKMILEAIEQTQPFPYFGTNASDRLHQFEIPLQFINRHKEQASK